MLLTVRKDGANKGRQFYKCSKPQGAGCDFFLWADQGDGAGPAAGPPQQPYGRAPQQQPYPPPAQQQNNNDQGAVNCGCGETAKLLTVNKDGANKGRQFYACPKPRDVQCNFFQWADEAAGGNYGGGVGDGYGGGGGGAPGYGRGGGGTRGRGQGPRGRGRGRGAEPNSGGRKPRKCGQCGQEGNKKNGFKQIGQSNDEIVSLQVTLGIGARISSDVPIVCFLRKKGVCSPLEPIQK